MALLVHARVSLGDSINLQMLVKEFEPKSGRAFGVTRLQKFPPSFNNYPSLRHLLPCLDEEGQFDLNLGSDKV